MKESGVGCAVIGVLIVVVALLGWGLGWFSLVTERPMAKYSEETRAQVYDQSRAYQQGTNRDLARYCEQMAEARGPARKAVAGLIRSTASTYDGPLTPDNQSCLSEARGY